MTMSSFMWLCRDKSDRKVFEQKQGLALMVSAVVSEAQPVPNAMIDGQRSITNLLLLRPQRVGPVNRA